MERDELKGKQTPEKVWLERSWMGTFNKDGSNRTSAHVQAGWEEEFANGGKRTSDEECEANAALYAEAHNVANETGLWPMDMVERIKALEEQRDRALERLTMARGSDGYNQCPPMIREWLYEARAILNKK